MIKYIPLHVISYVERFAIVLLQVVGACIKVTGTDTNQSATYDFLLVVHSNRGPISCTVSEINGDLSRKSQISKFPVYLTPPLRELPLECCNVVTVEQLRSCIYQTVERLIICVFV